MIAFNNPVIPKNGHTLWVILVARISTLNQDERSLDDQIALMKNEVEKLFDGDVEYFEIATQGSGEWLDRRELFELEDRIESGQYDLVISEDLARICRRPRALDFCEMCEDCGTRLIAINDRVDTFDEHWRDGAFISSWHHERSNRDTSSRIKRSLRNRHSNGALLTEVGPFYVVPDGATTIHEVQKKEEAIEIVEEGFRMLESGCSYSEVADWLNNEKRFPVGGKSRKKKWNCVLVRSRFQDPKLKGVDEWNRKKSKRVNKTGRRHSVPCEASEILTRQCEHLRYIEPERFDALMEELARRNAKYRRSKEDRKADPLRGRAKKRTPFPGQSIYCGICGRKFVFGGHGRKEHLMCDGARYYACWNSATIDGPLAAQEIVKAIWSEYEQLADFDETFLRLVNEEADRADSTRQDQLHELQSDLRQCERSIENLVQFIRSGDCSATIRDSLAEDEQKKKQIEQELARLNSVSSNRIEIPEMDELRCLAREALDGDAPFSWPTNQVMRRLIPRIVVFPCRLIDGGHIVNRAKFRLHPGGLLSDEKAREALAQPLEKILTVDLFEAAQREAHRTDVVALRKQGMKFDAIGEKLGIVSTAAQRAMKLQRLLDERGLEDAFEVLDELPKDYTRFKRTKHPRYQFDPLEDAGQF